MRVRDLTQSENDPVVICALNRGSSIPLASVRQCEICKGMIKH